MVFGSVKNANFTIKIFNLFSDNTNVKQKPCFEFKMFEQTDASIVFSNQKPLNLLLPLCLVLCDIAT